MKIVFTTNKNIKDKISNLNIVYDSQRHLKNGDTIYVVDVPETQVNSLANILHRNNINYYKARKVI